MYNAPKNWQILFCLILVQSEHEPNPIQAHILMINPSAQNEKHLEHAEVRNKHTQQIF